MVVGRKTLAFALLGASPLTVHAAPSRTTDKTPTRVQHAPRDAITSFCGQYDNANFGDFNVNNNLWGESAGSGSQCTYIDYSNNGDSISWQTSWTWSGGPYNVKSYSNAQWHGPTLLSSISSIPTTWKWSYTGNNIVADVSYDAFFAASPTLSQSAQAYEIMVWLAALGGAEPIGYGSGPVGSVSVGGVNFNLYSGSNSNGGDTWTVYSFVADSETTSFSGDLNKFFTYLYDNKGVPTSYYLQTIGSGTEAFTGSDCWFTVSPYSLDVNT